MSEDDDPDDPALRPEPRFAASGEHRPEFPGERQPKQGRGETGKPSDNQHEQARGIQVGEAVPGLHVVDAGPDGDEGEHGAPDRYRHVLGAELVREQDRDRE